ncbi:unnamed protein product [Bursaphelenchus okinawaensis]|uniref:Very long-chain fatty acid transport protein n=1 Tax=Bursaphelenchus okinawaensis TaxID=465554 RepID=A0A811KZR9_9BILA|nr:unnamed protein product [Bursaphelenchus okinawaensis]CAG9115012.1 unnamed protein product [Bursaphelenchus okinawaensis]
MSIELAHDKRTWLVAIAAAGAISLWLFPHYRRLLYTFPRDVRAISKLLYVKYIIGKAQKRNKPITHYFVEIVNQNPDKIVVEEIETGRKFTLKQLNELANQYANYFLSKGYKQGDTVGVFLENSADYIAVWVGLAKVGIHTAWLNINIKLEPLQHSITSANCKAVITSKSLLHVIDEAREADCLSTDLPIFTIDQTNSTYATDVSGVRTDISEPPEADINFSSVLSYIYTSGTTGNPKPAVIKHFRYFWISTLSGNVCGLRNDDTVYVFLPMYHSAGGILGVGQLVARGCKLVVRKKFSASNFWLDVRKYNCTVSQYIGEVARYLVAKKPSPEDSHHPLRVLYGNGLRKEIWQELVDRFKVKRISEFYGSTEGNANAVNLDGTIGACGVLPLPQWIQKHATVAVLRIDKDSGEFLRNKEGLCIKCQPGEHGHLIGLIRANDKLNSFEGYMNKQETEKKLVRDVFVKGDVAFASGDLFLWDEYGYLYFKDRLGDTYRWRGENVSTTEVESVLQPVKEIEDAVVYGVEVKGREGRAGMISATVYDGVDVNTVITHIAERVVSRLPSYAIPLFLRICKEVERTGTYKLKKNVLRDQGFNPDECDGDGLYYFDAAAKLYKKLDYQMYDEIQSGRYNKI